MINRLKNCAWRLAGRNVCLRMGAFTGELNAVSVGESPDALQAGSAVLAGRIRGEQRGGLLLRIQVLAHIGDARRFVLQIQTGRFGFLEHIQRSNENADAVIAIVLLGDDREVVVIGLLELGTSTIRDRILRDLREHILAALSRIPFAVQGLWKHTFGQAVVVERRGRIWIVVAVAVRTKRIIVRTIAVRIAERIVVVRTIAVGVAVWTAVR